MVIGVFQNGAIAAVIGATAGKDAYDIAAYLPRMMLYLFGLDLFRGISTSLFSRLDINKSEDPSGVFSTLLNGVILVSLIAIAGAEVFAGPLVRIVGVGLDPQTSQLAVDLARWLIPTLALISITSLTGSILLANHYYGLTEALAMFPKIAALIGVLVWGKTLGVWVLVFAMLAGLVAQLPFMFICLGKCGLKYSLKIKLKTPAIKSAILDAVPVGIGTLAVYLSGIFLQRTVSYGEEGTVACFNYSLLLCGILTTLVCRPAYTALAPRISRYLEAENYNASCDILGKSIGLIVLTCLAGASVAWTEAPVVVDLLFGRGRFTPEAIELTSSFLAIMFIGVLGSGVQRLSVPVLLTCRRARLIMIYCLITSVVRAVLAIAGRNFWGVHASAIAYVGGLFTNGLLSIISAVLLARLHHRMKDPAGICRWIAAVLIVIVLPLLPGILSPVSYTEPLLPKILHLVIVGVVTGLSILLAAWITGLITLERIAKFVPWLRRK